MFLCCGKSFKIASAISMESTSMINTTLPPGFRFHPTDEELIVHYLNKKVSSSENFVSSLITDIDLYKFNPWELPDRAMFGEDEWFFFSPRDRKYLNGARPNRAAASGYWKATGTDKPILTSRGSRCIGVKKALVFLRGRPPKGSKTNWMMYEYRLLNHSNQSPRLTGSMRLDDCVLCRIYQKSDTNSKQYRDSCSNNLSHYDLQGLKGKDITENVSYSIDYRIAPKEITTHQKSTQLFSKILGTPETITSNEIVDENGFLDFLDNISEYHISDGISEPQTDMQAFFVRDALSTIRRVLSVGALDERFPLIPDMSLTSLTSDDSDNSGIIESPPKNSTAYMID